jgi:tetratricopeptide (TPR) repeat protein
MTDKQDPNRTTAGEPSDALDEALHAALGPDSGPPLFAGDSVLKALGADLPQVQLRDPDSDGRSPVVSPQSQEMPAHQPAGSRLQLHGEIARGGMGAVLKGRDVDLGRDVAVKVLLESHAGKTELLQRFVEEAQIAGQLQHPGVVPVYDIGQLGDRRPYFTMKLIKGQTLSKLLAERKDSSQDRSRWLGIFLQVCHTLGYAHARGVIHRDLKPSNVMVGAYGEVQVMDWGLAKVLRKDEGGRMKDEEVQQTTPDSSFIFHPSSFEETQAGSILGTPAYMAPKQALGEIDQLDERADVFGLGAILCEILTGQPPYVGTDYTELHRKAVRAALTDAFAQLDACGADAELVTLCKRCLAAEPCDRPRDAGVVANELSAYLQGVEQRLRQAELARAQAEVKAEEERRRRRVQLALAAALAGLFVLGGGGGLYLHRQHELRQLEAARRQREQAEAVETALAKAGELRKQSRWSEAQTLLGQVREQLGDDAPDKVVTRLEKTRADASLVAELEAVRLRKAAWVERHYDVASAERGYAEVFRKHGLGIEGDDTRAFARRVSDSAVKEQLLSALDDWAFTTNDKKRRSWLMEVARRADPHPWRDRLRDPKRWRDRKYLQKLAEQAKPEELSLQVAVELGWALEAEPAAALLRVVQRRHPDDFWVNLTLGTRLTDAKPAEAVGYLRVAVALRPGASAAHTNLGRALAARGNADEAIACYRRAIAIDPRNAIALNNLGVALNEKGHNDEAIACYRRAIAIDPRYAFALNNLGVALKDKGKLDEAIDCYEQAIKIDSKDANTHSNMGLARYEKGEIDEAIACYRRALEIDPRYVKVLNNLSVVLRDRGKLDEAVESGRMAVAIDSRSAMAHANLGLALHDKGRLDEAVTCYRRAIDLDPRYARAHASLGVTLKDKGKLEEAIACYRRAIAIDPGLAHAHGALGQALLLKGRAAEARDATTRALKLLPANDPLRPGAWQQLQVCRRMAKLEEKLPHVLDDRMKPAGGQEMVELSGLCQRRQMHAAATGLAAAAFAMEPALMPAHRANAACSAALAGCGVGEDAGSLTAAKRREFRRQALTWLQAELALCEKLVEGSSEQRKRVLDALGRWQRENALAGLRDAEAIEKLSVEEQRVCRQLWDRVERLRKKAEMSLRDTDAAAALTE